jgi:hypothetical protein
MSDVRCQEGDGGRRIAGDRQDDPSPLASDICHRSSAFSGVWLREAKLSLEDVLERERDEGIAAGRERLEELRQAYLGLREAGVDRPLRDLGGERLDAQIARTKGVWVLWMLRETEGEPRFAELVGDDGIGSSRIEDRGGLSTDHLSAFVEFWVNGTGLPDYALSAAAARPLGSGFNVTMRMINRGSGEFPAPAAVRTEEGAQHYVSISVPAGETREVTYATITRPVGAAIDPEGQVLAAQPRGDWHPIRVRRWWIF